MSQDSKHSLSADSNALCLQRKRNSGLQWKTGSSSGELLQPLLMRMGRITCAVMTLGTRSVRTQLAGANRADSKYPADTFIEAVGENVDSDSLLTIIYLWIIRVVR